jgi:hypothetical protein
LTYALWVFVGTALFPRLAYWVRWPTRARGRLLLAYIAWNTALLFWLRQWFLPALADAFGKAAEDLEAAREQLRAELGREPTRDEVGDRLAKLHGWESSPLMPDRGPR